MIVRQSSALQLQQQLEEASFQSQKQRLKLHASSYTCGISLSLSLSLENIKNNIIQLHLANGEQTNSNTLMLTRRS